MAKLHANYSGRILSDSDSDNDNDIESIRAGRKLISEDNTMSGYNVSAINSSTNANNSTHIFNTTNSDSNPIAQAEKMYQERLRQERERLRLRNSHNEGHSSHGHSFQRGCSRISYILFDKP